MKIHRKFKEKRPFLGTSRYASIAAHKGYELGRKDDLESLGYVLVFLYKGHLPWQKIKLKKSEEKEKSQLVGEMKMKIDTTDLCKDLPIEFTRYVDFLKKLHF